MTLQQARKLFPAQYMGQQVRIAKLDDGTNAPIQTLTVLERGHLSWVTRQVLIAYGVLVPFLCFDEQNRSIILQPVDIINAGWAKYKED